MTPDPPASDGPPSSDGPTRVPLPVETRAPGGETNAYLVGSLLVDPAGVSPAIDPAAVDHVAVTHTHPDHVGGVAHYAAEADATVWAHADHAERFLSRTGVEPDRTFADGDRVGPARVLETPGHAPDHVCFATGDRNAESRSLLGGDLMVADGSVVVGAPEGDLRAYLESLRTVRDAGFEAIHPGHGPTITDPAATATRLIEHRLAREEAVLAAVEHGAETVEAVLDAAYEKDLTGVRDLARATVAAHLIKLADEGRIEREWRERATG
ncbi:MBL fold metallo-hydrolase [Haloparvum alkalitolerans]|uniref:MBL fold metallo-hydrolase n=1 Tax=Haloparvum alkalitolerans TaxID=1042953 RepID=UPI003CEB7C64